MTEEHPNPYSREAVFMRRAVALVRRRYGIEPGDFKRWNERHDRLARRLYLLFLDGVPLPEHWAR